MTCSIFLHWDYIKGKIASWDQMGTRRNKINALLAFEVLRFYLNLLRLAFLGYSIDVCSLSEYGDYF